MKKINEKYRVTILLDEKVIRVYTPATSYKNAKEVIKNIIICPILNVEKMVKQTIFLN